MQVHLQDRAPLERVRKLSDGRVAAVARVGRAGVQQYTGSELGRPDLATVNVYRPESEVFDQASLASFAHKSVTLGHPAEPVTADNWRKHSVGYSEGKIARDGDYIEIPLMLADIAAVAAVESGAAKCLSAGYRCELVWDSGVAPSGESYQAKQVGIVANHIALVPTGRAGPECRIGDAKTAEPKSTDEVTQSFPDAGLAAANAVRLATGRTPHEPNARVREIQDEVARQAAAKRQVDDAAVSAAVARYGTAPPPRQDSDQLAAGRAVRDAARDARYR